ncbi:MAG: hypothetical protein BWK75_00245 [Candidatus Altiarchaeales archaeon A3]|nr:MAG: hypothetical protein BWK75_00245 [Candidatus Altiarchaeales archaeon A3]
MKKISVHIAELLFQLSQGDIISNSLAKDPLIEELVLEGIIERSGRIKKTLKIFDNNSLDNYLKNRYSINNLTAYIDLIKEKDITRNKLVIVASDSKILKVRTFKGFLVNCYEPIKVTLNENQTTINTIEGTFQFIYDFEKFIPSPDITIVGVENPENFRYIEKQKHLFKNIVPLFISRYPQNQSKDLIKWLQSIPNKYMHYGDFDFAGIGIYMNEFKKYLANKTKFFIPDNIENLIKNHGNRDRYDNQKTNFDTKLIGESQLLKLIEIIHKYKKGLDQEILINEQQD